MSIPRRRPCLGRRSRQRSVLRTPSATAAPLDEEEPSEPGARTAEMSPKESPVWEAEGGGKSDRPDTPAVPGGGTVTAPRSVPGAGAIGPRYPSP
jgi:hypothetical protein